LASRLLANFLIQFHTRNKNAEMRLFNEYDAALKWVKEKIANDKQNTTTSSQNKQIPFLASV
jgi:hypothetical protein